MSDFLSPSGPPSLVASQIRRALVVGRVYLAFGVAFPLLLALPIALRNPAAFGPVLAIFLPVFAVTGSLGAMIVFTGDRIKGVYEYLIAYGLTPRRLFVQVLLSSFALVGIVLGVVVSVSLAAFYADGSRLTSADIEALGLYAVPMGFASVAFSTTVGMYWASLASPRSGLNSPVGMLPLIGMAPSLLTVLGTILLGGLSIAVIATTLGGLALVVGLLIGQVDRLLPRERLLSPG